MRYTYEFIHSGETIVVEQSMTEPAHTYLPYLRESVRAPAGPLARSHMPPGTLKRVRRVITGGGGTIFVGDDWADKQGKAKPNDGNEA